MTDDPALSSDEPGPPPVGGDGFGLPPLAQAGAVPHEPAQDALRRIQQEMPAVFERAAKRVATGELGFIGWGLTLPRICMLPPECDAHPWFFVGDVHGDFLALHLLLERATQEAAFRLCFLGDLVDRGPLAIECFAALLAAEERHPGRILWVLGNHDEAVRYTPRGEQKFRASVQPWEFVEWLNGDQLPASDDVVAGWGRLFVDVCRRLPRAAVFSDGLLATHGGIPLPDRWDSLKTLEAFHHERTLDDFTWTRAASMPYKVGWRVSPERRAVSSGFEFGFDDLAGFCRAAEPVVKISHVVRGHDHVEGGAERAARYVAVPLLTLNGFGFHYVSDSVQQYRKNLVIGVRRLGQLPEVEEVAVQPDEHAAVYPKPVAAPSENGPSIPGDAGERLP